MSIDIIGAGLGRTGTLSLKLALERLGFAPCYHMLQLIEHPDRLPHWEAATRGDTVDWDVLFAGYRATVDYPGCLFYRSLMAHYPEAKVILTVRDPETWYDSAYSTIFPGGRPADLPSLPAEMSSRQRMIDRLIWDGQFGGRFADRAHALAEFQRHIEEVEQTVPAERLLVFEVREGWEPLCAFLDVPVPDEPFPRTNSQQEFHDRLRAFAEK